MISSSALASVVQALGSLGVGHPFLVHDGQSYSGVSSLVEGTLRVGMDE